MSPAALLGLYGMRIVINEFISLDGVVQAPGGAEEDTDGGFRHGGWSMPYFDPEIMGGAFDAGTKKTDAIMQGRRTFEVMAGAWPDRAGDPFADWINGVQKYVVSDTLTDDDITWQPATIIRVADLVDEVSALRAREGRDISIMGSATLVRTLLEADLVDELNLMIEPIVLGGGKSIWPERRRARRASSWRRCRPPAPASRSASTSEPADHSARGERTRRPACNDRRVTVDLTPEDQQALAWAVSTGSPTGQAITARLQDGDVGLRPEDVAAAREEWQAAGRPEIEIHHHRDAVVLPDGSTVLAASLIGPDPDERVDPPDFGLYLDDRWDPPWPHTHARWPDFGLPADVDGLRTLAHRRRRARPARRAGRDRVRRRPRTDRHRARLPRRAHRAPGR